MPNKFNYKILIIGEDSNSSRLISETLSRIGYEVVTADSGYAGVEIASLQTPDLIIADAKLPDISYFEFRRLLSERVILKATPIIIIADEEITDQADEFLEMPVEPLLLIAKVTRQLDRKQAEAQAARFFNLSPDLICTAGSDGYFKRLNPMWEKTLGFSAHELMAKPYIEFVHPADRAETLRFASQMANGEEIHSFENRYLCRDSSYKWLSWKISQPDENHQLYAVAREVTPIKARQLSSDESQKQISNILESITDGFFALDSNWTFTYVNSTAERIWKQSREKLLGNNIWSIFPDAVETPFYDIYHRVMHERTTLRLTEYYAPADSWREIYTYPAEDGISVYFRDVTEQRKAAESIKKNEERFRALIENSADGITLLNSDATVIDISPSGERIFGYSKEELVGKMQFDFVHPEDAARSKQIFSEINSKPGASFTSQYRIKHSQGHWIWVESIWNNLLENENVQAIVLNCRNISDRKWAEDALVESREMFRLAMSGSQMGAWSLDLLNHEVEWSLELEAIFGLQPGGFSESLEGFYEKVYEEDREHVRAAALTAVAKHQGYIVEFRFHHTDGSLRWMEGRGQAIYDPEGKPSKVYGIGIDITERKQAEERLQQSEARFRSVFDQSIVGIAQADLTGRFLNVNEHFCQMLGYSRDELLEMTRQKITHPDDSVHNKAVLAKFVADGLPVEIEKRYLRSDGSAIWVHNSISLIRDGEGKPQYAVTIIKNITDRKQAEKQLRASEARLRLAIEISQTATFEIDLKTDEVQTDAIGRTIYGFEKDEPLTFSKVQSRFHPDDVEEVLRHVFAAFDPQGADGFAVEQRIIRPNNEIRWIRVRGRAFFEGEGALRRAVSCVGTYIDITELKLAEQSLHEKDEQLRQAQKLESVGRLAGGIAHDFNNMLTVINGYSNLTLKKIGSSDPLRNNIEQIKNAGERSAALTQQLLAFSRQQILQPKTLNLNEIIQDTSKMLKPLIGEDIKLCLDLSLKISLIKADPGQLSQVITNLVLNSRDAMPLGGMIKIETGDALINENFTRYYPQPEHGNYVLLKVSDDGSGMDAKTKEQIFEPFFTTKPPGEGTGLGLATVYGIIKQSGGYIWANSEIGKGTTFQIYLPQFEETIESTDSNNHTTLHTGTETILLVEDEETVRTLTKQMLKECGYKVFTAASGKEALEICRQSDCRIDLLMTDVVMPEMGGRELSEKLSLILPKLKVLFTSGYTNDNVIRHGITETGQNFIQKPYQLETLSKKLRDIINKPVEYNNQD